MRFITFLAAGLSTASAAVLPRGSADQSDDANSKVASNSTSDSNGPAAASSSSGTFWLDQVDHTGSGRGIAPYAGDSSYVVYRNVVSGYNAKNDGSGDQSGAIQNAIDAGSRAGTTTTKPAQVYIPGGTYNLKKTVNLRMGTIIMGDPNNPPVLQADSSFSGGTLINGYDSSTGHPEDSFLTQLRNVVIDTRPAGASDSITALEWGVAQGCALGNVNISMPYANSGHTGIDLKGGSTVAVTDVHISGGKYGITNSNQQVNFKNIYFKNCTTAYSPTGGWTSLLQGVTFDTCGVGIDMGSGVGDVVLLDSTSTNSGTVIQFTDSSTASGSRNDQVVIENLKHDNSNPIAIASGKTVLPATAHVDTWIYGNEDPGNYQTGANATTERPSGLLNGNGQFFMANAPTYGEYTVDQVVNVKAVSGQTVHGDGKTDDSAALNAILASNAKNNKVTYIPMGVYIVKDTLYVPANSRIMGEAWPVISGSGSKFQDASNPAPVVQVGKSGEKGVAHLSDMRFTVDSVLPGAKIVEVNMAGGPGDVGIWNSAVTIGGTADSTVSTSCTNQDTTSCMAAFAGMHLTNTSSAYIQNLWIWTADHDVDGGPTQIISTGRGMLVEATKATWLVGTAVEHNWLYNYNMHNAQNVFAGMQQTETPYMQGDGAVKLAPAPWTANAAFGDPDFSWCASGDGKCRTSLAQNVDGGQDIFLYAGANWAFFNGPWDGKYDKPCSGSCQTNMNRVANSPKSLTWYGVNTKSADTMVLDGKGNPSQYHNPGSWGGNLVAYRQFA